MKPTPVVRAALLDAIRTRITKPLPELDFAPVGALRSVVDEGTVACAELELGFRLPPLLRAVYTQVGDGGFGPAYGLLRLNDAVDRFLEYRAPTDDPHWAWPEKLLPIDELGCGMCSCVDCSTEEGTVVLFEPNPHCEGQPWTDAFFPLTDSLERWFELWIEGRDPMSVLME